MAPELWRAEPATRPLRRVRAGVLLYILVSGRPPTEAQRRSSSRRGSRSRSRGRCSSERGCDPRFAAIIDRCIRRDPFERYASGEDLLAALEALRRRPRAAAIPDGNPYRGLQSFESEHRALFFGRARDPGGAGAPAGDALVRRRRRLGRRQVVAVQGGVARWSTRALDPARQWASATSRRGATRCRRCSARWRGCSRSTRRRRARSCRRRRTRWSAPAQAARRGRGRPADHRPVRGAGDAGRARGGRGRSARCWPASRPGSRGCGCWRPCAATS
jgi:hypothetical protein